MNENKQPTEEMNTEAGDSYAYVGKEPKRIKLSYAICAMIICIVVAALTTFALCTILQSPPESTGNGDGEPQQPEVPIVENGDVPSYFENLLILDQIFKHYSFDGFDEDEMSEAILDAYVAATGDVYAEYLNAQEYEDYFSDRKGELVGIGVSVVQSQINVGGFDYTVIQVISVFKDSPAMEHGVMPGDAIMFVKDGDEDKLVNEIGYTQALDVMLGEAGTKAEFTVYRQKDSDYERIDFSIERRKVTSETVTFIVSETDKKVGIINITGFDLTTPTQFKEAINTLRDVNKCEYFVFDVRNNPGGSLNSIVAVLSYFLDEGDLIVSTEYSTGKIEEIFAEAVNYVTEYDGLDVKKEEIGMYKDLECIVITNENTASAAELFTATLRDYGIAEVVGVKSYGKGCMQNTLSLESFGIEGGIRVTTAMYYSKSKTVYHGTGIVPDHEVELSEEAKKVNFFLLPEEDDAQLLTAIDKLVK